MAAYFHPQIALWLALLTSLVGAWIGGSGHEALGWFFLTVPLALAVTWAATTHHRRRRAVPDGAITAGAEGLGARAAFALADESEGRWAAFRGAGGRPYLAQLGGDDVEGLMWLLDRLPRGGRWVQAGALEDDTEPAERPIDDLGLLRLARDGGLEPGVVYVAG